MIDDELQWVVIVSYTGAIKASKSAFGNYAKRK